MSRVLAQPEGLPGRRLSIRRLTLTDFRCYRHLRLETDSRPVVLTGANGAGKTNLLEALSFLAPGRGLRRATLAQVARRDSAGIWAVAAVLDGPSGRVEIGTGIEPGSTRRALRLDGEPVKAGDVAGLVAALWLTPAMDRVFMEGASGRRRFLDRLILAIDHGHAAHAGAYDHAMRERNRVLKEQGADPGWLTALEAAMAKHGVAMAAARRRGVAQLDRMCAARQGVFPAARLALMGDVEHWLDEMDEAEAEARLTKALVQSRSRDAGAGATTIGPHRTDLDVRHAAKNLNASDCSTGEQKAVLISMVLSQARVLLTEKGLAPLMLLDEVVAHLDQTRRLALFDELVELDAQSWMTGADQSLFDGFEGRAQFFQVADATILNPVADATNIHKETGNLTHEH